jgi:hypothetical protein
MYLSRSACDSLIWRAKVSNLMGDNAHVIPQGSLMLGKPINVRLMGLLVLIVSPFFVTEQVSHAVPEQIVTPL